MDNGNDKTISKNPTDGLSEYLDFDVLRSESIAYLGKLAGKIWTDHNVHDPGITTLEILCYAILDLGYRTNQPAVDLFTPAGDTDGKEKSFFTAAQILTCNPLTITDFRKLLIDIPGINNAWLEVATDVDLAKICESTDHNRANPCERKRAVSDASNADAIHYLNGLYHVYVDIQRASENTKEQLAFENTIITKIRKTLMAHRNICEDFIDITVLCEDKMGVCADIEINPSAAIDQVYLSVFQRLQEYFSPLPKFYTLENLLDRGKNIDEIFAGRSHDLKESHGFVDTDELDKLELVKQLHLSDVYSVLLSIPDVIKINKLKFRKCDIPNKNIGWEYQIPMNHVVRFDPDCTSITFTSKSLPIVFDHIRYADLIRLNIKNKGKFLYDIPSALLDSSIPRGINRPDLAEYVPLQNEFPKVYGLTEGDLPATAGLLRRVQSLQFRGYLLFFDQLLCNYLAQLQNVGKLFSFAPGSQDQRNTYFSNQVNMPGIQDLVRFNIENDLPGLMGFQGSLVALPVHKKDLMDRLKEGYVDLEQLAPFKFTSRSECKTAIGQLLNDISLNDYKFEYSSNKDECVFFYLITSSEEMAIVGRKYFTSVAEATRVADTLRYAGLFEENYRVFITSDLTHSFSIDMNMVDYSRYLQKILESEDEYYERRKSFLDHLLLRFSEKFSDYAILSYQTTNGVDKTAAEISHKEKVLMDYDRLSSNRGRAYDYLRDGWNNDNVSGFEKRVTALLDIPLKGKQALCNFEVAAIQKQYVFKITLGDEIFFVSQQLFSSPDKAADAASELFKSLGNKDSFSISMQPDEQHWTIQAHYGSKSWETGFLKESAAKYTSKDEAVKARDALVEIFQPDVYLSRIHEETYKYGRVVQQYENPENAYTYSAFASTEEEALDKGLKDIINLTDPSIWTKRDEHLPYPTLMPNLRIENRIHLLDESFLKAPDINDNIEDEPNKHYFTLAAKGNAFVLTATEPADNPEQAMQQCNHLKVLLLDENNYHLNTSDGQNYQVQLRDGEKPFAETRSLLKEEAETRMNRIRNIIRQHTYVMTPFSEADSWSFTYNVGFEPDERFTFKSSEKYSRYQDVLKASKAFHKNPGDLSIRSEKNNIVIVHKKENIRTRLEGETNNTKQLVETLNRNLKVQKQARQLIDSKNSGVFEKFVELDPTSRAGTYYYRLVDKNNLYAAYREDAADKQKLATTAEVAFDVFANGYNYLELQSGEVTIKVTDQKKKEWYHYQVKSVNPIIKPGTAESRKLVLFISVKGYKSKIEATDAFHQDFEALMEMASHAENYGPGRFVELKDIFEQNDFSNLFGKTRVRVPEETINFLGGYEEQSIAHLVDIVKSYPLRRMKISDTPDCFELFPSPRMQERNCIDQCPPSSENTVYYFVLYNKSDSRDDWQSVHYYETAADAMKAFNFFILLLRYIGNYIIDCDCSGRYRLFVREVLAEGVQRFENEEKAWGEDGVLNFICVQQSANTLHLYEGMNQRACCHSFEIGCNRLTHPYRYDIPQKRDSILTDIKERWNKLVSGDLKLEGNLIRNNDNLIIATIISKPGSQQNDKCSYAIEIAPGIHAPEKSTMPAETDNHPDWVTPYCYLNTRSAFEEFNKNIRPLLNDMNRYQPVFDCTCGSYGIEIYDRIAFNPQCYNSAELACEAARRVASLTNNRGLHFVEHILLRPNAPDECINRIPACCDEFNDCKFVWTDDNEDICEVQKPIWFLPGYDPYSFIATVAMPGWPSIFRRRETRLMMEDLLRREVPAHVMLRVLWLTPYDLCRFESLYRKWGHWIAGKECGHDFDMHSFIGMLFTDRFGCLDEDVHCCDCCKEDDLQQPTCFADTETKMPLNEFADQMDQLYCWPPSNCHRPRHDEPEKPKVSKSRKKHHS